MLTYVTVWENGVWPSIKDLWIMTYTKKDATPIDIGLMK